jgi:uncharacterized RDD family membrane protein YckC
MPAAVPASPDWPGRRLGLPASGPRSIGRFGRRLGGITIDWALSVVVSIAFFHYDPIATLLVFAVTQVLFLLTLNGSVGHLIVGLRLVPVGGGYLGWWRPLVRTFLLAVLIPAVIWDKDQRGLHDIWSGTVLVRR